MYLKTDIKRAKWVRKTSEEFASQTYINALVELNGKIYGGSYPTPLLLEWNGADDWIMRSGEVGTPPNEELGIESLAVFNGKIYGGTHPRGKLAEWNGSNAWAEVAPQYGSETQIFALAVYNGKLYGGTNPGGKLLEWNGSNAWVEVAPKSGDETKIQCLLVYNEKLYAGTYPHGKLLEWNGSNAWVEVAGQPSGETQIHSLCEFEEDLYGGGATGKLYKWNGSNAWVEVAAAVAAIPIWTLSVFKDKLIGCTGSDTGNGGTLLEWNGSDAWTLKIATPLHTQTVRSAIVFNDELYVGTENGAMLFQLDWAKPASVATTPDDELKIYVLPKGTTEIDATSIEKYRIIPQDYRLRLDTQDERLKARELEITTERRTPISLFSRVVAVEAGRVLLNGYVEKLLSRNKETQKYLIKGNEGRLFGRFVPKIAILETFDLPPVIQNLLWMGDSFWPPGTPYYVYDSAKNIIFLSNGDTKTDLSNSVLSVRERGLIELTPYPALSDLQTYDNSYYVAPNGIYIRVQDSNWYSVGGLYVDRHFDNFCRLGSAPNIMTWSSQRVMYPDLDELATYIYKVLKANGFYISLSDDYNFTYINYSRTLGRTTNRIVYEKDLLDFEESGPSEPHVKALICRGESYQFATVMDGSQDSPIFAKEDYPGTYCRPMGLLKDVSVESFNRRNAEGFISISCERSLIQGLMPGDSFLLKLDEEATRRVQLSQLSLSSDGKTNAQLGSRIKGISDFWKDKIETSVYEDGFLQEVLPAFSETATFKPRDRYHNSCTLGSVTITIPAGLLSGYGARLLALLDVSFSVEDRYSVGPYPWKFTVWVNDVTGDWGNISEGSLSDGLNGVDVSDLLIEGENTIEIMAWYSSEFTTVHSACADGQQYFNLPWMGVYREWKGHPDISASVSINFFQMMGTL